MNKSFKIQYSCDIGLDKINFGRERYFIEPNKVLKLINEGLKLDVNDYPNCWHRRSDKDVWELSPISNMLIISWTEEVIPALTLQDLMVLIPEFINTNELTYWFELCAEGENIWNISYKSIKNDVLKSFSGDNLLNIVFEMICWTIDNGYYHYLIIREDTL